MPEREIMTSDKHYLYVNTTAEVVSTWPDKICCREGEERRGGERIGRGRG